MRELIDHTKNCVNDPIRIALDFMSNANPDKWDGIGEPPKSFNSNVYVTDIDSDFSLHLYMLQERDGWCHKCLLYARAKLLEVVTGYGIDSVANIRETIEYILGLYSLRGKKHG